ncbi:S-adenosyl-L-methionine-dependent methyltransferase [Gautieria morchelliformis]|nr:S-adenosyl-L-methionine-dependent methyltransferase [Gautieria morchelliformis]
MREQRWRIFYKILCESIKVSGPIPVSTYIQLCLSHPTEGYYMRQRPDDSDVFGVKGDFTTSPEISQVFGELVCLWLLSIWRDPGRGSSCPKIRLVELGPGRGTLIDDMLRTLSMWPNSRNAITSVHLVENSSMMRSRQAQKLAAWRESQNIPFYWWDSIEDMPVASDDEFTMVVAHEFFDALPVNIIEENIKTHSGFREILVDLRPSYTDWSVASSTSQDVQSPSQFRFVLSPAPTPRSNFLSKLSPRFADLPSGSRVEVSSSGWRAARKIGEMGAALIIDYGDEHAFGSSFRAFRDHRHVDVFDEPGASDLTTNVDFALLKEALQSTASLHGTLDQSTFLLRMGIAQRLAGLMDKGQSEERRSEIGRAGMRLVDRAGQGMGRVYRVLGLTGGGQKTGVWPFIVAT